MGPRVFLPGPDTSGLEAQVLGPNSDETLPQAGREAIPVARTAYFQGPLWNLRRFRCRDGFYRYYHLFVEDIQIRRVTAFPVFSLKEVRKKTGGPLLGWCFKNIPPFIPLTPRAVAIDRFIAKLRTGSKASVPLIL